jgi:hypothetical protein
LLLSSQKYDPEHLSQIRIFPIPDSGVKKAPDPGSGAAALVDISNNIARCIHRKKMLTAKSSPITVNLFYILEK